MSPTKGKVDILIQADDKASAKMQGIGKSTQAMAGQFNKASIAMAAMGAGLIFALGKMVNSYSKAGDEVAKMAKRTGFGTEALSELRHVANITGTDLGSVEKATKRMSKTIVDASEGMATYVRAFERIGIEVQDLMGLAPEQQFWTIANAIGDLDDATIKAATAQDIFGRAGTQLLPMLEETEEGLADLRNEAHELGIVFDEDAAKAAEAFEDAKIRLATAFTGMGNAIAEELMPKLTNFIETLTEKMKPAIAWLSEHPEVTAAFVGFAAALGGAAVIAPLLHFIAVMKGVIVTIYAFVAARIAALAAMGPVGWAILAGGVIAAGAAIAALTTQVKTIFPEVVERPPGPPTPPRKGTVWAETPSMQFGGIVPGPRGQPVPVIAHGGEFFAGQGGFPTVNVYVQGSVISESDLAQTLREEFIRIKDRNTTIGF